MSLLLRNIPAVVVPSGTLPAITGSGPPITEHHSYFTDANGQLTFGSVDLPGAPSEATATSHPPQKNAASASTAAVAANETGLAEWLELAEALALLKLQTESESESGRGNVRRDGAVAVTVTAEPTAAVDRVSSTTAGVSSSTVDPAVGTGILELLELGAFASAAKGGRAESEIGPEPTAVATTLATSTSNSSAGVWNSVGILPLSAGVSRTDVGAVPQSSTMRGEAGIVEGAATGMIMAIAGTLMTLGL